MLGGGPDIETSGGTRVSAKMGSAPVDSGVDVEITGFLFSVCMFVRLFVSVPVAGCWNQSGPAGCLQIPPVRPYYPKV